MVSRRNFIKFSLLGGATTAAVATGIDNTLEVVQLDIPVPQLPQEFAGYRIAFITDLHMGTFLDAEVARHVIATATAHRPDLLLLGGDMILNDKSEAWRAYARACGNTLGATPIKELPDLAFHTLAEMLRAVECEHGIIGVYGNHDLWEGPRECAAHFGAAGIRMLRNQRVSLIRGSAELLVYGSDDYWTGIPTLSELPPRHSQQIRLLLSHNPDFVGEVVDTPRYDFDLALCGHTHGGQIKIPGLGGVFYNVRDPRFRVGLSGRPGRYVYTSRGIGYVELPFRIGSRPELTMVTLSKV